MKTSKFFLSTLIAASAMTATAYADYTWDRTRDYSFAWDFSQTNTQNGQTGVLGGTVTNTFATENIVEIGTVIKEGDADGQYWEVDTNSFFYDSLVEVTSATEGTGTLTFSVDYYWTGAQWGENILHIGCNGTGVALGLSNGYISFATGTATDAEFAAEKTNLRLTENAWNTITWTLTGDSWSVSNGVETVSGEEIADIIWDASEAERNKYSIGIKAPGWNSGATGLNDSRCMLANLSVAYTGDESLDLVWAGGADGGIWDGSTASWEGGSVFAYGDSVTFNTADATVTVSGTVAPGTVTISENTTFTGTDYKIEPMGAVTIAAGKTLTLDGSGTVSVEASGIDSASKILISADSTLSVVGRDANNASVTVGGTGTIEFSGSVTNFENNENRGTLKINNVSDSDKFTGTVRLKGVQVDFTSGGSLGDATNVILDNGSLHFANTKTTFDKTITIAEGSNGYIRSWGNNKFDKSAGVTISGSVSGDGTLIAPDDGDVKFTGTVALGKYSMINQWGGGSTEFAGKTTLGALEIASNATVKVSGSLELTTAGGSNFKGTLEVLAGGTLTLSGHDALGYNNGGLDSGVISLQGNNSTEKASLVINDFDGNDNKSMTLSKTLELKGYSTVSATEGRSFNSWNGEIKASGIENEISSTIGLRKELIVDVEDGGKLIISGNMLDGRDSVVGGLLKSGSGELTLSGNNTYTQDTTISAGTLVAASTSALGSGNVSVANGAKLQISVENVDAGTINLASGATLVVDLADFADVLGADNEMLTILTGTTLTFGDVSAASDTLTTEQLSYLSVTDSSGAFSKYVNTEWSYSDGTLSLTLTIPEPSAFGLLAGVGALALVASRRRRSRR